MLFHFLLGCDDVKKKLLVLLLLIPLLISGCSIKKEKLILATEAGFAPYEYYENGEIVEKPFLAEEL